MPNDTLRADERLTRTGQQPEQFLKPRECPVENLIVIGASAGGYHALQEAVKGLSWDLPAAVIILLHSGKQTIEKSSLKNLLRTSTDLPIQLVLSEERMQAGRIYLAPPGQAVFLKERTLWLEPTKSVHPVTTINQLFESAAKAYHERVIGVILSGLLRDGTAGLRARSSRGGIPGYAGECHARSTGHLLPPLGSNRSSSGSSGPAGNSLREWTRCFRANAQRTGHLVSTADSSNDEKCRHSRLLNGSVNGPSGRFGRDPAVAERYPCAGGG